ncbi:MAG: tetratricopeptide repeat protein [Verrucomicrobiales bacterium]|nr:tetratricopeptide repeat protein [Verrucomicrobiales bacterium]
MNLNQLNFDSAAPGRGRPSGGFLICALLALLIPIAAPIVVAQEKEQNLAYADLLYSQKEYAKAARQYQIFIRENPTSPNVQSGWFRLGECYLQVGQAKDASTTFQHIVKSFKTGAYVGSAAYRLAVLSFNAKDYNSAVTNFEIAARELTSAEAKHQATYYHARSLQFTKQFDQSLALYDKVIKSNPDPSTNPFHERSLLESARIYFDKGEKDKAKELFLTLSKTATTQTIREESIVRAGLIAAEAGQIAESEEMLNQAFRFPDTSPWKSLAQVGAIFNAYSRQDYDRVISIYGSGSLAISEEYHAKMLLIVGHSYRIKGEANAASKIYSLLESKYPNKSEGMDAGYRKLQILHQQGTGSLPTEGRRYVERVKKINPKDPYIDTAMLMVAEFHFTQAEKGVARKDTAYAKKNYLLAANAYGEVREENIKDEFKPVRLYKQGWAYLEAGELENGILAISRFIKRFPDNPLAASALAKRGNTYQSVEDFTFALDDYQKIIEKYPNSPELELAMQQKALIYAHQRNLPKMIDSYEQLLKRFPNTSGKDEATYWIGVGHFDLEDYAKAIPPLELARRLNPEAFTNRTTIRMILAHYQLEQIPELTEAARTYIQSGRDAGVPSEAAKKDKRVPIPKPVLEYIGRKLAKDRKYEDAEFFLTHLSTPDSPKDTSATIWKVLAECRMSLQKYSESVPAWDNYLVLTEEPIEKGYAYLQRGKSQLALTNYDQARDSARECLRIVKQGRVNAEARILLGDIAAGEGDLEGAVREYLVVSQIFEDKEITPIALTKAINVYLSLGDQEEAAKLKNQLGAKFPDFRQ